MAEITQKEGTWSFDGEILRLVPGRGRGVHQLRTGMGEVAVPLAAIASVSFETGRKRGRLRLRMRAGADPFAQGAPDLPDAADPYGLPVGKDRFGAAQYLVDEVRNALLIERIPVDAPSDRYLLPGPPVPRVFQGSDGRVRFDGERLRLEWDWGAEGVKKEAGPQTLEVADLDRVEWTRATWESGSLRFVPKGPRAPIKPAHDPYSVVMWGVREAREISQAALMVAAVTARLPHPFGKAADRAPAAGGDSPVLAKQRPEAPAPPPAPAAGEHDHDAVLRRLRELGELRAAGTLTEEEFAEAKRALLDRLRDSP